MTVEKECHYSHDGWTTSNNKFDVKLD